MSILSSLFHKESIAESDKHNQYRHSKALETAYCDLKSTADRHSLYRCSADLKCAVSAYYLSNTESILLLVIVIIDLIAYSLFHSFVNYRAYRNITTTQPPPPPMLVSAYLLVFIGLYSYTL